MTHRTLLSAGLVAGLALLSPTLAAQNLGGEPLFGTVTLSAGFMPDPHRVSLTAGGETDLAASGLSDAVTGSSCVGMIAAGQPDVRLHYSGGMRLQIGARSSADTSLLINLPDGTWRCVDDTYALQPALTFEPAPEGQYDVWVGTFGSEPAAAELLITEFAGGGEWQTAAANLGSLAPTQPSLWGDATLSAGFLPDPMTYSFMAAGSTDLGAQGIAPLGYTTPAPSMFVHYDGGSLLRMRVRSSSDTVLLVLTPTGEVVFNDDRVGLDPMVELTPAPAGTYAVWVGTVAGPSSPASVTLEVSELSYSGD